MTLNPTIMTAVEKLGYRVTVGDVASQGGLEISLAQQGLLTLANEVNGHLQVADTGEIVYLFPPNFRNILRNKYWKLRLQEWAKQIWKVLFYLIRISFGIILILSIVLMLIAISIIVIAVSSNRDGDSDSRDSGGGGIIFLPNFWFSPDIFWLFTPNYYDDSRSIIRENRPKSSLNFLESIFSFLFGDGIPNPNLEQRRWENIGAVIRANQGAVVADQLAPYLDNITEFNQDNEDYVLPVLIRFNGYPQVSPEGDIIYYFPELQVTAKERNWVEIQPFLKENLWQFSQADSWQKILAIGLGCLNFILVLMLGSLLTPEVVAQLGGFIGFINSIYGLFVVYATGYLTIPLIRYFWIQQRNKKIEERNQKRLAKAQLIANPQLKLQQKINYAQEFANEKVITEKDITYSTEKDLFDQL